jgi:hypothetical protein
MDPFLGMLFWFFLFLLVTVAVYRWVFRVNDIVEELKKHTNLLERILDKLNK